MATLTQSLVSSSSRRLAVRARPDLTAQKQRYQGRTYWVVKDPVALQYFRFEEEEFAILQMLDGELSLDEVAERFEAEFPPQTIRSEELQHFIGTLHRNGLVLADAGGQGEQLKKRRDERRKKETLAKFSNVLAIKFKGIDPDWLLSALYPWVAWFFTKAALYGCLTIVAAAAALVLVQFDVFQSKLPEFDTFFSAQNWLLVGAVVVVTKTMHEFGHGLSCKHFGGECHEMGLMLLVLTPCPYCNVSDSWMLPSRWHRMAIGAAGMYVEVVLASICTFVWWFTEPGLLNYLCLYVMFVSSVSTILFNANPLLRYDGYYILSDYLEIPNLRQKASSILSRKLGKWCLGLEEPEDPFLPKSNQAFFALFTVASALYRWVVVLSILYFLNKVFEPYGLKVLGQLIACTAVWGLVGQPVWKLYKYFKVPGRIHKVKRLPLAITLLVVAAAFSAVAFVPLPSAVYCPMTIAAHDAESVYVEAPGLLEEVFVKSGDLVEAGQPLARLVNESIDLEVVRLEGQIAVTEAQIAALRASSYQDTRASARIDPALKSLKSAQEQLAQQLRDKERLVLHAPIAGRVIPPTYVTPPGKSVKELPAWHGTPLDQRNLGASLEVGVRFCQIGDPRRLEARLAIEQNDIDLVSEDQQVEMMLRQSTDLAYLGKIESLSRVEMPATPPRLSSLSGGDVPTQADDSGTPKPLTPHFEAIVPLTDYDRLDDDGKRAHELMRVGLVGEAKIHIKPRTLAQRLWRYMTRTFNFEL
ncbi:putative peptide zinc metalloprotease protein YydH [Pseudobythopirellula maris]|uniref:Putative peptide zinc metalloprotease protein YydH n=1 Tax=Pseudobythopirellula maris TaxID=2527991 RepID=A0A5C5ZTL7_9BACT|nr:biotin/lipoyl-binding protein [Pseudobythopirellula maris]TWT90894.1 putative peptide zinc metalloprotease protein YydH [Pseudobythopirellula maris]